MKTLNAAVSTAAALILAPAAPAAADNTSFGSFGDKNLGGSLGPNGFTSSLAGTTVAVDGMNTLNGSFSVTTPFSHTAGNAQYGTGGYVFEQHFETTAGGFGYTADSELGLNELVLEPTFTTPNGSVSLVCDPLCHQEWPDQT